MTEYRRIDSPPPTIVGPRPAERSGVTIAIPQGIERLMTLGGISPDWRKRILADPIAAARDARIALAPSEQSILRSIPRPALAPIIDSFGRKHAPTLSQRIAVGAAAAVVFASTLTGAVDQLLSSAALAADNPPKPPPAAPGGIRSDMPEAPQVAWLTTLDDALALAAKSNRAVMVVFLHPGPARPIQPMMQQRAAVARPPMPEETAQRVCQTDSQAFREAVRDAALLAARIAKPVYTLTGKETPVEVAQAQERFEQTSKAYDELLKKFDIAQTLPAVLFLAPDGSVLSKAVQPVDEAKFIETVKAVPPLLAKWITDKRKAVPAPPATDGIRPDRPAMRQVGVRADVP